MANRDANIIIIGQERTGELSWAVRVQCGQFQPEHAERKLDRCLCHVGIRVLTTFSNRSFFWSEIHN
jgi:hypothetical protein